MTPTRLLTIAAAAAIISACGNDALDVPAAPVGVVGDACAEDADCAYSGGVCLTDLPGGYCSIECSATVLCPSDSVCATHASGAVCALLCESDTDCRNGYFCETPEGADRSICQGESSGEPPVTDVGVPDAIEDAAVDVGAPPEANYGEACTEVSECTAANGLPPRCLSDAQGFAGGYCSAPCASGIDDCGDGAICLDTSVGGLCVRECGVAAECRDGYGCCSVEASAACLPSGLVADCAEPEPDPDPEPEPGDGELGEACGSDDDCGAGIDPMCFSQIPGGYCTSNCETDDDCGGGVCANLGGFALCLAPCGSDGACPGELECCDQGFGDACLPSIACF